MCWSSVQPESEKREERYVIVVTTPLQILFAFSLLRRIPGDAETYCVVIGGFSGAESVAQKLAVSFQEEMNIEYFRNFRSAMPFISSLHAKSIFVDTDVGTRKFLELLRFKVKQPSLAIAVYEEGLGTYRSDLYSGKKKRLLNLFGIGTHFGGCILTSEIHVLLPRLYEATFPNTKTKIVQIQDAPMDIVRLRLRDISWAFSYEPVPTSGEECSVYLSSWGIDGRFIERLAEHSEEIFFKPHPKFKGEFCHDRIKVLPSNAPAELVITDLASKYQRVKIYHHGSSAAWYCDAEGVEFVEL